MARADIEVALALFNGILAETSLAPQCAEVVNRLVSKKASFQELHSGDDDLSTGYMMPPAEWETATEDFFNVMGWGDMSPQF